MLEFTVEYTHTDVEITKGLTQRKGAEGETIVMFQLQQVRYGVSHPKT
jgi:hypothetical protein